MHGHPDFKEAGKESILPRGSNITSQNNFRVLLAKKKKREMDIKKAINKVYHTNSYIYRYNTKTNLLNRNLIPLQGKWSI